MLKSYSKGVQGLENDNYWERLKKLRLSSVQRRMERYRIMYVWKVITEKVPNFGLHRDSNHRRGRMIHIKKYRSNSTTQAKNLIDQSLGVHGGGLFNLLPVDIRNFEGSTDNFKMRLDEFLNNIPDKPQCEGLHPDPINSRTCKNSNTLMDWVPYLNIRDRRLHMDPMETL